MTMTASGNSKWKSEKLENICVQVTDGKHGDCQDEPNSGFYFLSCKDIVNGQLNYDNARQITQTDFLDTHRRTKFAPYDILITNSGTIGRMALAPDNELTRRTTFQKSVAILKPNANRVETNFLYYALQRDISRLIGFAGGTAQKNLLLRDLRAFEVNVPPLSVQQQIADILSTYDELIENCQRRIKILESMARALYREWFVHFRFPGHENHPRVASSLGEIPQGWGVKSLADLMEISGGSQPPKSEFIYQPQDGFVRLIQIRDYESDNHITFVRESPKLRRCRRTDILIARYGASVARICSGLEGAYNVALAKVIPVVPNCQEFLRQLLSDDEFQKLLIGMSGRAAQNGFNKSDIAAVRVAVPIGGQLFERFEQIAVPIWDFVLRLRDKIENLRRTRDLLLPRLLSDQIEVRPPEP